MENSKAGRKKRRMRMKSMILMYVNTYVFFTRLEILLNLPLCYSITAKLPYLGDSEQGDVSVMMTRKIKFFPCIKVLSFDAVQMTFPVVVLNGPMYALCDYCHNECFS
jgi:hypothetical protein